MFELSDMNNTPPQAASPYGNPQYPQSQAQMAPVMTMKDWMIILLIMLIPLVNIIMMFVWAFGEGNPNRQNHFKASLLFAAILLGLYLVFGVLIVGVLMSAL